MKLALRLDYFFASPLASTRGSCFSMSQVPSFVYSKSHIPEQLWGTNYNGLMHVTDWAPTILGAIDGVMTGM